MPPELSTKVIGRHLNVCRLAFLLAFIFPVCALSLAITYGYYNMGGWWLLAIFALFVGVDQVSSKKWANPTIDQLKNQKTSIYHSSLPFLCVPAALSLSLYGAYFFTHTHKLNWAGRIGWIISLGLAISALALTAGHELIHAKTRFERLIGGFLFAFMFNAAHKIEHLRSHHPYGATPEDAGTASLNQSFYHFLPRAFKNTVIKAWYAEKQRLNRSGNATVSWHNAMLNWHLVTLGIAAIYYCLFSLTGIVFYVGQGLVALAAHHLITYIQHYGLRRRELDDGRYEKFSVSHAWSCNFLISNLTSFCLPRHTDHHLNPGRPYQLRHHLEESPQMPLGYFGMFFMALVPQLWFKVMNPRVLAYFNKTKYKNHVDGRIERKQVSSSQLSI